MKDETNDLKDDNDERSKLVAETKKKVDAENIGDIDGDGNGKQDDSDPKDIDSDELEPALTEDIYSLIYIIPFFYL